MQLCKVERMISITTGEDPERFNCTLPGLLPTSSKHYCQIAYPITVFRRPFKYVNNCKCKCLFLSCLRALFQICHNFRVTALKHILVYLSRHSSKREHQNAILTLKKQPWSDFISYLKFKVHHKDIIFPHLFFQWKYTAHKTVFIFCNRIFIYLFFTNKSNKMYSGIEDVKKCRHQWFELVHAA